MIKLIINADDFGYSKLFNKMILELIEEKSVTSTSVMVDEINESQKEQVEKLIYLSEKQIVSVGLHVYFKNTDFLDEINRQFKIFVNIFRFEPSHIDIHKIDYIKEGYPVIQEFCKEKKIPCKNLSILGDDVMLNDEDIITTKNYVFNGTWKSFEEIKEWLSSLKDGFNVINFHPGYYDPNSKSSLNKDREVDAKNIRKIITILPEYKIELANFYDLSKSFS